MRRISQYSIRNSPFPNGFCFLIGFHFLSNLASAQNEVIYLFNPDSDGDGTFSLGPTTEIDDSNKQAWFGLEKSLYDLSLEQFGGSTFSSENFPVLLINQGVSSTSWSHARHLGLAVRCIKE